MSIYKYISLIAVLCSTLHSEDQIPSVATEVEQPPESFTYGRIGAFSWLILPIGVEAAIGHRYRSERWGWGPLINVSAASFLGVYSMLPVISIKFEVLYYPKSWNDWYWGFMPGVGMANMRLDNSRGWNFLPSLELCFGKEYLTCSNEHRFYYFSISPLLTISFNYGWGF